MLFVSKLFLAYPLEFLRDVSARASFRMSHPELVSDTMYMQYRQLRTLQSRDLAQTEAIGPEGTLRTLYIESYSM